MSDDLRKNLKLFTSNADLIETIYDAGSVPASTIPDDLRSALESANIIECAEGTCVLTVHVVRFLDQAPSDD